MANSVNKTRRKHVPQRTCIACRIKTDKRQLTRIVETLDGGVVVDPTGKLNGRGAYLCNNPACWDRAIYSDLLDKALKTVLPASAKRTLREYMPKDKPGNVTKSSQMDRPSV